MKNLSILTLLLFSLLFWSCGGNSEKSVVDEAIEKAGGSAAEVKEMQKNVKEMAERAKEMEEEDDAILSDKNLELLGLTATERKISDDTWEKANTLAEAYKAKPNEELRDLTNEDLEQMIMDAGFNDIETAKNELEKVVKSRDHDIGIISKIGGLKTTKLIDGEEEYEKEMKELGDKINEIGYTADDLKALDENVKITVPIAEFLYRLNN
ncbi:MAG: hypothetical protein KQH79_01200 [Bacteroidetes bacterium]|nr:hypothetical protein [Bacteroidota bacterium]